MSYSDLIRSIRSYKPDNVKRLLQDGVDINAIDSTGDTPLMAAVRCNRLDLAQLLLDKEADTGIRMHSYMVLEGPHAGTRTQGHTVREWAMQNNRQPAISLLEEHEQRLIVRQRSAAEAFRHATISQKQEALKIAAARHKTKLRLMP